MKKGWLEIGAGVAVAAVAAFDTGFAVGLAVVALVGLGAFKLMHGEAAEDAGAARNDVQVKEKKERVERLMAMLQEKGEVTNNDVEQLLGVSDATATRYLSELEARGYAEQIPETGRGVVYRLKKEV
jgi:predicted HTH transcriptional regulator